MNQKNKLLITLFWPALLYLTSCVPARQYEELQGRQKNCADENLNLKSQNQDISTKLTECDASLQEAKKHILQLVADSMRQPNSMNMLTKNYDKLNETNELLLNKNRDLLSGNIAENKKLVGIHGQAVRDMHAVYPDAKLVYIVRDGRDVLNSERVRNFVEESKFLTAEDKRIIADLQKDLTPFTNGSRSIFTEVFIRRVAEGWVKNLKETEAEAQRLYNQQYHGMRYEDLLSTPFAEMSKFWKFLDVKKTSKTLEKTIQAEMASNPDEEWQAKRNEGIASFLPKGQAGNWQRLFTEKDKSIYKNKKKIYYKKYHK